MTATTTRKTRPSRSKAAVAARNALTVVEVTGDALNEEVTDDTAETEADFEASFTEPVPEHIMTDEECAAEDGAVDEAPEYDASEQAKAYTEAVHDLSGLEVIAEELKVLEYQVRILKKQRNAKLRELFADGASGSKIAKVLGITPSRVYGIRKGLHAA